MMRLDIRSLLQDAAIEEVRVSLHVKMMNYGDVAIMEKIKEGMMRYDDKRDCHIIGTIERCNCCQLSVFHYSYQRPKYKGTSYILRHFWSPDLRIFEEELKPL